MAAEPFTAITLIDDPARIKRCTKIALWAGLPVLTCRGATFAGRVAASPLTAIGLPELVANSLEEYETIALKFASELHLLATIKPKLVKIAKRTPYSTPPGSRAISKQLIASCGTAPRPGFRRSNSRFHNHKRPRLRGPLHRDRQSRQRS